MAGQSGYGIWDRTTKTGQPRQVSLGGTERTSQDTIATLGWQHGENLLDRTAWTGESGKDRDDWSART